MKITMVKKILRDGTPCRKCIDVQDRIEKAGQLGMLDEVLLAEERDPWSDGMLLAGELGVQTAPFFVVTHDSGQRVVYTSYLQFVKEVLSQQVEETEELKDILQNNPDMDFL